MKFKVGDRVTVLPKKEIESIPTGNRRGFVRSMYEYCGKDFTVEKVFSGPIEGVILEGIEWLWSTDWLKPAEQTPKFYAGDRVTVLSEKEIRNLPIETRRGFVDRMYDYCGSSYVVDSTNTDGDVVSLREIPFVWKAKWLKPTKETHEFKVGDRVRVKPYEQIVKLHPDETPGFISDMVEYCESEITVLKVYDDGIVDGGEFNWHPDWLEPAEEPTKVEISLSIDPRDPKSAHKAAHDAVSEAISRFKGVRHEWSVGELRAADELSARLFVELMLRDISEVRIEANEIVKSGERGTVTLYRKNRIGTSYGPVSATNSARDPYNKRIGLCVCLCKATGTPIPEFIAGKKGDK